MEAQNVKAGDVIDQETIKHPWSQTAPASVPSESAPCEMSLSIYCCLSMPNIYISLSIFMASKQDCRRCVVPCPRYFTGGDAHQLICCCLGVEHASSQFLRELTVSIARSRALLPPGVLWGGRFGSVRVPHAGLSVAEAQRWLAVLGSQTNLTAGVGAGSAPSQLSHASSSNFQFWLLRNWYR